MGTRDDSRDVINSEEQDLYIEYKGENTYAVADCYYSWTIDGEWICTGNRTCKGATI